jgi:hypothetical protein
MKHGTTFVEQVVYPDLTVQTTAIIPDLLRVKNVTGNYTITQDDATGNWMVRVFTPVGTEAFVTIPVQTVGVFDVPIGSKLIVSASGLGKVTIQPAPSVTLNNPTQGVSIERKYGRVVIIKTHENVWDIDGQLGV